MNKGREMPTHTAVWSLRGNWKRMELGEDMGAARATSISQLVNTQGIVHYNRDSGGIDIPMRAATNKQVLR